MDRWVGKIAVITGASAGIGATIAKDLATAGMITIGLARRSERIDAMREQLEKSKQSNLIGRKCDMTSEANIKETFEWIETNYGGVDVLINNAGVWKMTTILQEDNSTEINETIDVNLLAPIWCIREAFKTMKKRNTPGHIVIINSILGHRIGNFMNPPIYPVNIYPSTKYGMTALTEVVRQELLMQNTKIKISSISPGEVKTEIVENDSNAEEYYKAMPHIFPDDISNAVLYVLGTPERVQVHELIIKPIGEFQ